MFQVRRNRHQAIKESLTTAFSRGLSVVLLFAYWRCLLLTLVLLALLLYRRSLPLLLLPCCSCLVPLLNDPNVLRRV